MAKLDINTLKTTDGKIDFQKVQTLKPLLEDITKEELIEMSVKLNRDPYMVFPDRLPTMNKMPLPIDENKHIGNYESKHNLYLTLAHAYNKVMAKIEALEVEITKLKNG